MDDGAVRLYTVVVNFEDQYSIWPAERALPRGWAECGTRGTKEACLGYIAKTWVDMTPASIRVRLTR